MTDNELERAFNTCGKNFLAFHLEDIAEHYDELAPRGSHLKDQRIRQYYRDRYGFYSKDVAVIRAMLIAVLRTICDGHVLEGGDALCLAT